MKKINIAINGLGRIGRAFLKLALERPEFAVVGVNDLGDINNLAYLLRYDSVYGGRNVEVSIISDQLSIGGKRIQFISEKDPAKLPWKELDVDVVIEATGVFTSAEKARAHLDAGARRVVITAPIKEQSQTDADLTQTLAEGEKAETVLMGINEEKLKTCDISSNASCTTNAASPLIAILNEKLGIEKAMLNTVHAYTASQNLVDGPSKKDLREGRAAAQNIVPSSTGAAIAVAKVFPSLEGKFDGISMRVPVVCGSIVDVTFISKKNTTAKEVNEILKKASNEARWKGIFSVTEEDLVSSDIIGNTHASIADLAFTRVVDGNLIKVIAWYDNEEGYASTLVAHALKVGKLIS